MDFTTMIAAVDFTTVTAALASVGAAIIGVYVAGRGIRMVLSFVK